jgi:hypothetical protein
MDFCFTQKIMTDHSTDHELLSVMPANSFLFYGHADQSSQREVIRLDKEGFHYHGQFVADAGEAHCLMLEFFKMHSSAKENSTASVDTLDPAGAGFDGGKGVRVPALGKDFRVRLLRGSGNPSSYPERDFKEQLVWLEPVAQSPRLLWCNANNDWFDVLFVPTDNH